ncbi:hypothetical protein GCM10029992_31600 [Glycomyces albus]
MPEVAVELVVGVLADRAGVEHDQIGLVAARGRDVPGVLEQTSDPLGVMDVHLAAESLDPVGPRRVNVNHQTRIAVPPNAPVGARRSSSPAHPVVTGAPAL